MTEWPSDQVTEWPSDRVTEWPSDRVTEWLSDQVTEWSNDWVTGWQEVSHTIDHMVYFLQKPSLKRRSCQVKILHSFHFVSPNLHLFKGRKWGMMRMRMRTGIVHNMLCVKSESIIWIVDLKFKYLPSSPRHITTTDGDPACRRSSLLELSTNSKVSYFLV